jgi:hypothetical protein
VVPRVKMTAAEALPLVRQRIDGWCGRTAFLTMKNPPLEGGLFVLTGDERASTGFRNLA